MAQIIAIRPHTRNALFFLRKFCTRSFPCTMGRAHRLDLLAKSTESIEQSAMHGWIDKRTIVMLAMDLDKRGSNGAQSLHTHRLIVDESPRAPICHLHAAQDELAIGFNILCCSHAAGSMIGRQIENGCHLALCFARAHERTIATPTERESASIEQNGFARARLAGENRQSPTEFEIETIDQDDVANGELDEHVSRPAALSRALW
jgi:hypothetical protein